MSIYQRDPAAPGANVGRRRVPSDGRLEKAVARFNAGEGARTVAGLCRTLGRPTASVGASAGSSSEVRITVAWGLCWYQWGVDVADERRPVFEIARGGEVRELDRAARHWNAAVARDGRLTVGVSKATRGARRARWLSRR